MKPNRRIAYCLIAGISLVTASAVCCSAACSCPDNDDCGCHWERNPPCVKVTFSDVNNCSGYSNAPDGEYILSKADNVCVWVNYYGDPNDPWIYWSSRNNGSSCVVAYDEVGGTFCDIYFLDNISSAFDGPADSNCLLKFSGHWYDANDCVNNTAAGGCEEQYAPCDPATVRGYGGTAIVEPIWDCNDCPICGPMDVDVNDYHTPVHYGREDCCPAATSGEPGYVKMTCSSAGWDCSYGEYTIEVYDPNVPGDWVEVKDSNLVTVSVEPNVCTDNASQSDPVKFTITGGVGRPPAKARVICRGIFIDSANDDLGYGEARVDILPAEAECCDTCSGGVCTSDGTTPPDAYSIHPMGSVTAGAATLDISAGMKPGGAVSDVKLHEHSDGQIDVCVRLGHFHDRYIVGADGTPFSDWSASVIDDSNTVKVTDPDGATYVYEKDNDYKLSYQEYTGSEDPNFVCFDYNDTNPDQLYRQIDGNQVTADPNRYIKYTYNVSGELTQVTAYDETDTREYTLEYDGSNRLTSFSGSCQDCGSGAYEYDFDSSDRIEKVLDANDPNVVLYEYVYNSSGWLTDIYIGEVNDANHFRKFDYTVDGEDGSYIVDIYDYTDANNYRVVREYRDSSGLTTKRIQYEQPNNEDPANPTGDTYTEHIFYTFDANGTMTKKVVIPPTGNSANPNPDSGLRRVYTYDDEYGRLKTETWYDTNDVNFTVVTYKYEATPDGNHVRIDYYDNARGSRIDYTYAGNSVDPNLKEMPVVDIGLSDPNQQLKYIYEYDFRNRVTLEKQVNYNNVTLLQTKYVYDDRGNLTKRYDDWQDSNETTVYQYNGFNELTRTLSASNVAIGRTYYDNGKLKSEFVIASPNDVNVAEPSLISQTKYSYDNNGRLTAMERAVDDDGSFSFGSPDSWVKTEYEYDVYGNRTKVIEDATGMALETVYSYNNQGQVIKVTEPNGKWTQTTYDGRGLVATVTVGYGSTESARTDYFYDDNGNIEQEVAPDLTRTTYEYDDYDRLIKLTRGL